jgi:HEAT repeat protein
MLKIGDENMATEQDEYDKEIEDKFEKALELYVKNTDDYGVGKEAKNTIKNLVQEKEIVLYVLMEKLDSNKNDKDKRIKVIKILGELGDSRVIDDLKEVARSDPIAEVSGLAAWTLLEKFGIPIKRDRYENYIS